MPNRMMRPSALRSAFICLSWPGSWNQSLHGVVDRREAARWGYPDGFLHDLVGVLILPPDVVVAARAEHFHAPVGVERQREKIKARRAAGRRAQADRRIPLLAEGVGLLVDIKQRSR